MKGKALGKQSLHEKTAVSVLLKLFISSNKNYILLLSLTIHIWSVHKMLSSVRKHIWNDFWTHHTRRAHMKYVLIQYNTSQQQKNFIKHYTDSSRDTRQIPVIVVIFRIQMKFILTSVTFQTFCLPTKTSLNQPYCILPII